MTTKSFHSPIPDEILALSHQRDILRRRGKYDRADALKRQIEAAGYAIKDNPGGAHLVILPSIEIDGVAYRLARHVPSLLREDDHCLFSVNILAHNSFDQVSRCVESVLRYADPDKVEIVLFDNASQDELSVWATALRARNPSVHYMRASRVLGEAEARNLSLKRSCGRYILLLDQSVELTGDIFTPLAETLANENIGITGLHGLTTDDLRHFEESEQTEVEAVDKACMAFRRSLLKQVGLFDEGYRYPSFMDVDFNFAVRDSGASVVVTPALPVTRASTLLDDALSEAERSRLTRRNFYRFLGKWGDREDLLVS